MKQKTKHGIRPKNLSRKEAAKDSSKKENILNDKEGLKI